MQLSSQKPALLRVLRDRSPVSGFRCPGSCLDPRLRGGDGRASGAAGGCRHSVSAVRYAFSGTRCLVPCVYSFVIPAEAGIHARGSPRAEMQLIAGAPSLTGSEAEPIAEVYVQRSRTCKQRPVCSSTDGGRTRCPVPGAWFRCMTPRLKVCSTSRISERHTMVVPPGEDDVFDFCAANMAALLPG
jgi:hypothetical protein